ncbi:MAG: hypothetical protein MK005_05220 [Alcanivorax sp.]|nr:hypothetical protein [Alcanivorax sp.]
MATILSPEDWQECAKAAGTSGAMSVREETAKYPAGKEEESLVKTTLPLERRTVSDEAYRRIYEQAARDLELIRHGQRG